MEYLLGVPFHICKLVCFQFRSIFNTISLSLLDGRRKRYYVTKIYVRELISCCEIVFSLSVNVQLYLTSILKMEFMVMITNCVTCMF